VSDHCINEELIHQLSEIFFSKFPMNIVVSLMIVKKFKTLRGYDTCPRTIKNSIPCSSLLCHFCCQAMAPDSLPYNENGVRYQGASGVKDIQEFWEAPERPLS
jgi:hypothetical protein